MRLNTTVKNLSSSLKSGSFIASISYMVGGTALAQVIVALSTPLITRVYDPKEFGTAGIVSSIAVIFSALSTFRIELLVASVKDEAEALLAARTSVIFCLITNFVLYVLITVLGVVFSVNYQLFFFATLILISAIFGGIYQVAYYFAARNSEFKSIASTRIVQSIMQVAFQLLMGLVYPYAASISIGDVIGRSVGVLRLGRQVFVSSEWNFIDSLQYMRSNSSYIFSGLVSGISQNLVVYSPALIIGFNYGVISAGIYLLVTRVFGAPLSLIGQSVGQVYFSKVNELMRNNEHGDKIGKFHIRIVKMLFGIAFLIAVSSILVSPYLEYVFGSKWHSTGPVLLALLPFFFGQLIVSPISNILVSLGKVRLFAHIDVARATIALSGLFLLGYFHFSLIYSIMFYSLVMLFAYFIMLGIISDAIVKMAKREAR